MARTAKFELPDGRKGALEIPDGASQQDIEAAIQQATGFTGKSPAAPKSLLQKAGGLAQDVTAKARTVLRSPQVEKFTKPLGQAIEAGTQNLPAVTKLPLQALGAATDIFKTGGAKVTEALAGDGLKVGPSIIPGVPNLGPAQPGDPNAIRTSPEIAALIGTGFQMTPDIVAALATPGILSAFKSIVSRQGLKQGGSFLKKFFTRTKTRKILTTEELAAQKLTRAGQAERGAVKRKELPEQVKATAEKELRNIPTEEKATRVELLRRQKLTGERFAEERGKKLGPTQRVLSTAERRKAQLDKQKISGTKALASAEKRSRVEIEASEKKAGIFLEETPAKFQKTLASPEQLIKKGKKLQRLIKKGPEHLAKTADVKTIQANRKLFEQGLQKLERSDTAINKLDRRMLRNTRNTLRDAIGIVEPRVGKALQRFGRIKQGIDKLPKKFAESQAKLKSLIAETKEQLTELSSQIKTPKVIEKIKSDLQKVSSDFTKRKADLKNIITKSEKELAKVNDDLVKAKKGIELTTAKKRIRTGELEKGTGRKIKRAIISGGGATLGAGVVGKTLGLF